MAAHDKKVRLRRALAAAILPFAALGVAGCDDAVPADEVIEEEMPAEEQGEQEEED